MGMPHPTPLIQIMAASEDQTMNTFRPLRIMLKHDNFAGRAGVGQQFIVLPGDGRIEAVTSSALSRLGNPITFGLLDETGMYTRANKLLGVGQIMRRGLAGMSGRSIETTNAYDPADGSYAQLTAESASEDIFKHHVQAPASLSYGNRRDRRKIHKQVYAGSAHVDLDAVEAEAAELLTTDPATAERFYGNRIVAAFDQWVPPELWEGALREKP